MNVRCWQVTFSAAPDGAAGKTLASVVVGPGVASFRATGVSPDGSVDLRPFRNALPEELKPDAWVYAEWVGWLEDLVDSERAGQSGVVEAAMSRLVSSGGQFGAVYRGCFDTPEDADATVAVDGLLESLLGEDPAG